MVLGAFAAGATAGAAAVSLGLLLFRNQLTHLLPVFLFAGIVVASAVGWYLARPIADWWRRGVTAVIAVFGAMLLTALTAPVDMIAGQLGLAGFTIVALALSTAAARYSLRSRARER